VFSDVNNFHSESLKIVQRSLIGPITFIRLSITKNKLKTLIDFDKIRYPKHGKDIKQY